MRRITFEVPDWMEQTALHEVNGLAHVSGIRVEAVPEPHQIGPVEPSRKIGRPPEPPNLLDLEGLDLEAVEDWISEGWAEATDGCVVEPDGVCPHGCRSKLLEWGLI